MKNVQKVKKVLSIDMDYVMAPCIDLYNDCAGMVEFEEGNFWERVNIIRGIDKYLSYDEKKFVGVLRLLAAQLRKLDKDRFFFAEEHDMILEFLCNKNKSGEVFDVYNVDHHHDIYYGQEQKSEVERFDFACIANWVYYLGKNNLVNKYFWVRNENSSVFPREEVSGLSFPIDFDTYCGDLERLIREDIEFDYVFVCRSNEYFPEKFNHLFDALYQTACAVKDYVFFIWNTPYCIDGKSRPVQG